MRIFLALALAAAMPVAATHASPVAVTASTAATYDFKVGALRLTALNDGEGHFPNDGTILSPKERVATVLATAGLPTDKLDLTVSGLLVRDGARIILIDTGYGAKGPPTAGHLKTALAAAGVAPGAITDIVISHPHGDHIGGLLDANGAAAFPNARLHIAAAAWDSVKVAPGAAALVAAETPHLALLPSDGRIAPGMRAVPIAGHTPGHIGVEISNGGQHLLYIGDAMHHYVASVAAPDLTMAFDADGPTAMASRKALIARAAAGHLRLYAPHFPFPGLGTIRRDGDAYAWVPEAAR